MPEQNESLTVEADNAGALDAPAGDELTPLSHLAELLEAEPDQETRGTDTPGGDDGSDGGGDAEETTLRKFNDLAGRLGVELDALYALEISDADGEAVTIEQLKDHYTERGDFTVRQLEVEEQHAQREAELLRAQQELRELVAALPENALRPEVLDKLRAKREQHLAAERTATLDAIPAWRDEKTRLADIEGMGKHLASYGYPENHLGNISDHRQLRYIRDNYLREQRIRQALEAVRKGTPKPAPVAKPTGKPPQKRADTPSTPGRDPLKTLLTGVK